MVKFLVWLEYNETNFAVDLFMLIDNTPKFSVEKGLTCIIQRQRHGFRPHVSLTVLRSWIWEQCCNCSSVFIQGLGPSFFLNAMYKLGKWC